MGMTHVSEADSSATSSKALEKTPTAEQPKQKRNSDIKPGFIHHNKNNSGGGTGFELTGTFLEKTNRRQYAYPEGKLFLRFFTHDCSTNIRYMMQPVEAYMISGRIARALASPEKVKLSLPPHKFKKGDIETTTTVTVEKFGEGDKTKISLSCKKGTESVQVIFDIDQAEYLSDMLKFVARTHSTVAFGAEQNFEDAA